MSAVVIDLAPQIYVLEKRTLSLGEDDGWLECDSAIRLLGREVGVVVAQLPQTHAPATVNLDHHWLTHTPHRTHRSKWVMG